MTLVSSADETAFGAAKVLGELGLLRPHDDPAGRHRFLSSGDVQLFRELGRRLLGPELDAAEPWHPGTGGAAASLRVELVEKGAPN